MHRPQLISPEPVKGGAAFTTWFHKSRDHLLRSLQKASPKQRD